MKEQVNIILLDFERFKEIMKSDKMSHAQLVALFFKEYCNYSNRDAVSFAKDILMKGEK